MVNSYIELRERLQALNNNKALIQQDSEDRISVELPASNRNFVEELYEVKDTADSKTVKTENKPQILDSNSIEFCTVISTDNNSKDEILLEEPCNDLTTSDTQDDERIVLSKMCLSNSIRRIRRLFKCKMCDFSCRESSKYQNHKRTNHYAPGICNICGKSMRTDNLQKHIKSHSAMPVMCDVCNKVFKNSESLRSHKFSHSGEVYNCTLCPRVFKYKGEFTRHKRIFHGELISFVPL